MTPRIPTDEALAAISRLASADSASTLETDLRAFLSHRSNFVVAKAVALAEERGLTGVAPDMIKAFPYFMEDCIKRDPGRSAKLAIVNCLCAFAEPAWDVFLAAVGHVQKEPAFGGPIDTAATLRGISGRGLMAMGHHDAFRLHALLIADREPMTRTIAVETLSTVPDERAELLLRSKIVREPVYDSDPVTGEARDPESTVEMSAFEGLMKIAPDTSFSFVAAFLNDSDADRLRGAALALGESRLPEAYAALRERWSHVGKRGVREALALPIALVRSDEAFAFLLDELAGAPAPLAEALIEALALFRDTPARADEVKRAVDKRESRPLAQVYRKHFEPDSAPD